MFQEKYTTQKLTKVNAEPLNFLWVNTHINSATQRSVEVFKLRQKILSFGEKTVDTLFCKKLKSELLLRHFASAVNE